MSWHHFNPVQIEFGVGSFARLAELDALATGQVLLVTTEGFVRRGQAGEIVRVLGADRVAVYDGVTPNPEIDDLDAAVREWRPHMPATILALGGGSAIDAAKALAVALPNGVVDPLDTLLRRGQVFKRNATLPVVAIPTTSGTGSEVTPFATVWDGREHRKHSIAGSDVYPRVAVVDPELTLSLPPQETLYTALDAISHALESLWNRNRTPLSESFATRALSGAVVALPAVLARPQDLEARVSMQQASLLAGMAISQTRTAIAHSISYALTSHFGVPHGLACSFTLPNIIAKYLDERNEDPVLASLMRDVRLMLVGLELDSRLQQYASLAQIESLKGEMVQPGRADNYVGRIDNLEDFIRPQGG
ncbi:phosphonoacetaldehyde reductase [Lysobacter sp. A03]|uniref:phosphonoacetaldehyde reductase n=1 Tax=Lysobacter sp. A03 TaxID=1199154 RepID=UPI0005B6B742|nr:phosphonoacetaldehyde reductase [Lysobacter sp. A03]KIQ97621.1 Alcohol dehydrogenase [Lysobacter sp. A03]